MYFIDSHCHLDLLPNIQHEAVKEDELPVKTITVTNSPLFFEANNSLFGNCKNIRVALGLHPELVSQYGTSIDVFQKFISKTRYIGEIGIDGSKEHASTFQLQVKIFKQLIEVAKSEDGKIITIHSRRAVRETLNILKDELSGSNCKVILHWFTGTASELKSALDIGCYFSVNHKMMSSERSRENIKLVPLNRLLTETDAPFTINSEIKTRLHSLEFCVSEIGRLHGKEALAIKDQVYNNFKKLIS